MKISVVVPVYNVEEYIVDCLESIVHQTYRDIEIILVDDGSTDRSGAICDEYARRDNRITVIHKENGGLVSARKAGVALATGEYTSYVDSDDWIDRDMYEKLLVEMGQEKPDVMAFGYVKEYATFSEIQKEYLYPRMYYKEERKDIVKQFVKENNYFYTPIVGQTIWSKLIKTEIIKKKQQEVDNRIKVGEDCVSYACILEADTLLMSEEYPYHYRVRKNSIMHQSNIDEYERYKLLIRYLAAIVKDEEYLEPLLMQMAYYFLLIMDAKRLISSTEKVELLFPDVKKNNRIVLYGKGVIGKSLYSVIVNEQYCDVKAWVDSLDVEHLLNMNEDAYDYVLITIGLSKLVRAMEEKLIEHGVPREKIKRIQPHMLTKENLPEDVKKIIQ